MIPAPAKTVMAGLLIKELLLRGDAANVMVVSPGVLVDQWDEKRCGRSSGLEFEIPNSRQDPERGQSFARGGLWLARLDVLARNSEGILDKACDIDWDLIIFDEAHKMSATVWGNEVKKTKRYQMAEEIGKHTRNLLMMTAHPALGEGKSSSSCSWRSWTLTASRCVAREGSRRVDVSDLMRRLVKEELRTFEGTRLFPERFAFTVRVRAVAAREGTLRRRHRLRPRGE